MEKRKFQRREIERQISILLPDQSVINCLLLDISQTGARITLEKIGQVPDEFVLVLRDDLRRKCSVKIRNDDFLGVEFTGRG